MKYLESYLGDFVVIDHILAITSSIENDNCLLHAFIGDGRTIVLFSFEITEQMEDSIVAIAHRLKKELIDIIETSLDYDASIVIFPYSQILQSIVTQSQD